MGIKRTIKNKARTCICCGNRFAEWQDKHVHRIDREKRYSETNIVVVCARCKKILIEHRQEIFEYLLPKENIEKYFEVFGLDAMELFFERMKKALIKKIKREEKEYGRIIKNSFTLDCWSI